MKISELATTSGVTVPTIKYYLREHILMAGVVVSATQADYGTEHLRRLRLIRALSDVAGLPLQKIKIVLALIEDPGDDLFETLGRAITALPPYLDEGGRAQGSTNENGIDGHGSDEGSPRGNSADQNNSDRNSTDQDNSDRNNSNQSTTNQNSTDQNSAYQNNSERSVPDFPRARAALAKLGQLYDPHFIAVAQLDRALDAVEEAGIPLTDERLTAYAEHLRAIAAFDLSRMPAHSARASVEYAVLGTALYEPVMIALRRLAHQDLASRMLADPPAEPGSTPPAAQS
ncbi:MerR family transcriptional regulator [Rathayibacter soli]|uniref:MerR family transcriptional regulator n=1 Tax=Rathayibacter soli TaxID=3144168 RepID=UPI0027E57F05|nr:MerR family transcriptional regulator [Glaciibacter superstes]